MISLYGREQKRNLSRRALRAMTKPNKNWVKIDFPPGIFGECLRWASIFHNKSQINYGSKGNSIWFREWRKGSDHKKKALQRAKKWWAINRKLKVNSCLFVYFIVRWWKKNMISSRFVYIGTSAHEILILNVQSEISHIIRKFNWKIPFMLLRFYILSSRLNSSKARNELLAFTWRRNISQSTHACRYLQNSTAAKRFLLAPLLLKYYSRIACFTIINEHSAQSSEIYIPIRWNNTFEKGWRHWRQRERSESYKLELSDLLASGSFKTFFFFFDLHFFFLTLAAESEANSSCYYAKRDKVCAKLFLHKYFAFISVSLMIFTTTTVENRVKKLTAFLFSYAKW